MIKSAIEKSQTDSNIVIQKYGGATLADPEKIKQVAKRVSILAKSGTKVVVAVSAMGKTTNQLIALAQQVSRNPHRRELDMLLTTGERVSMALMAMALHDVGCDAISFTGSQAGILTNNDHVSAHIIDVKASRVLEALDKGKIVILAGFQGVSPTTKEITTLGRGGTDTTAVAMAAFLNADRCEILKDVAGVFTADPQIVAQAKPLHHLSFDQILEMTYWGAKVLHYRSVELAKQKQVKLLIGSAQETECATIVSNEVPAMYESSKILGLNSHECVVDILVEKTDINEALKTLKSFFENKQIATPQILSSQQVQGSGFQFFVTGPQETTAAISQHGNGFPGIKIKSSELCSVTATCTGVTSNEIADLIFSQLQKSKMLPIAFSFSAMSLSLYLKKSEREKALQELHQLI